MPRHARGHRDFGGILERGLSDRADLQSEVAQYARESGLRISGPIVWASPTTRQPLAHLSSRQMAASTAR